MIEIVCLIAAVILVACTQAGLRRRANRLREKRHRERMAQLHAEVSLDWGGAVNNVTCLQDARAYKEMKRSG